MSIKQFLYYVVFGCAVLVNCASAIDLNEHPKVKIVADKLVASGAYTQGEINALFAKAEVKQNVLDAMMNPAEYKFTWGKYRKIFLKPNRIQQGADFWREHEAQLSRAEQEYGVPAEIIVAIIGVESKFGQYKGKFKVLDSLVSLVTGFPRRSKFFAGELEEFLILSKENNLDATQILGSYAGAVGYPQFISSSYRNYAVDFNNDGSTDLINQVDDAIGSIANYFIENGWKPNQAVTSSPKASVSDGIKDLANRKRKVQYTAAFLRSKGAVLDNSISDTERMGVLMLDTSEIVHDQKKSDVYIVRAGDTACRIAERHKVSCKKLIKLNKLNAKADIFRGQRLALPSNAQKTQLAATKDSTLTDVDGPKPVYFFTHHNFYAITKYNHSVLYAMAVYDLSEAIAKEYKQLTATQ